MPPPRIPPLPASERDARQQELVAGVQIAGAEANIFTTFVRHPGLMRHWLAFSGKLLFGKIPPRDREVLILRTGWNCQAEYEWAQHVRIGRDAGLRDDEILRISKGADAPGWDAWDITLLHAADELHAASRIADATWASLSERYDERQLIEVPMLVGQYHLVAMSLNSFGVELDEGLEGFPT